MAERASTIDVRISASDYQAATHGAQLTDRARVEADASAADKGLRILPGRPATLREPNGDIVVIFLAVPA